MANARVSLKDENWKQIKLRAVNHSTTASRLVNDAIEHYLSTNPGKAELSISQVVVEDQPQAKVEFRPVPKVVKPKRGVVADKKANIEPGETW